MKNLSLKTLFAFITGICLGLVLGIGVSNRWHISVSFGHDGPVTVNGVQRPDLTQAFTYFVQATDSDGETASFTNNKALDEIERLASGWEVNDGLIGVPLPPPLPPILAPPGSENDPDYQAEIIENENGGFDILPAPAYRKK